MPILVDTFTASLDAVHSASRALPALIESVRGLDDAALLAAQRVLAEARRGVDACASLVAGEIGYRSRRELGYAGLAQREGLRTPELLVQRETGSTAKDAAALVQVGGMVHDSLASLHPGVLTDTGPREPWLAAVGAAVAVGTLSVDAAKAIRSGLGSPTSDPDGAGATMERLAEAAATLLQDSYGLDADQLFRRARDARDDLDEVGIANRERVLHEQRGWRRTKRANGLSRYTLDPDIESAAFWDDVYDKLTSPRRGGARFVNEADKAWAEAIATDERSTEQFTHDAITQLMRIGVYADTTDSRRLIGSRPPAVSVLVAAQSLATRTGRGRIEGCAIPISIASVERAICESGTVDVTFDEHGEVINLGREQRLYNRHQRIALAARDGGCLWGDCDRPPSWTEAHHIEHWKRDRGKTDVADGVLLCRYHHLLLHNNNWQIRREKSAYWLIPPPTIDPTQTPRPLHSKSAAVRDLHGQHHVG
jgi:hypothetical protein